MDKKFIVRLKAEERAELTVMINKGKSAAQKIKHANIQLKIDVDDANWPDTKAAEASNLHIMAPRTGALH